MANWQGLLSDPRLMDLSTGLLSQSGYSTTPVTFGQAMGGAMQFANQRQVERVQLESTRAQLQSQIERRDAMKQLEALLSPGTTPGPIVTPTPAAITTPQGQAQAMGLLGQIAPEAMAQSVMSQMFGQQSQPRVSAELNTFAALNPELEMGTPEFRESFNQWATQNDLPEAMRQQLEIQLLSEQLTKARTDREAAGETRQQAQIALRRALVQDASKLVSMFDLNQRLEGTALASGLPMPEVRRAIAGGSAAVQRLFGISSSEADELMESFDTFNKFSTDFVVGSLDRMAGTGSISIPKFEALIASNASLGAAPGTNRTIIASNIEAILEGAAVEGITLPNETRLRAILSQVKPTAGGGVDLTPEERAELEQLRRQQGAL
jgi:hypothetical protein